MMRPNSLARTPKAVPSEAIGTPADRFKLFDMLATLLAVVRPDGTVTTGMLRA